MSAMVEECSVDVCKLDHDPPEDFSVCVCQHPDSGETTFYLFVRELLVFCHFAFLIWEIVITLTNKKLKLHIFFDFWVQILLFFSSEMGVYGAVQNCSKNKDDYDDGYWDYLPWYCRIYWALFSAALPSTTLSCIVFWSQVYKKKTHVVNIVLNTASPSLAVFEFILVAFPLRLLHFIYFVIFYTVYILFTLIYHKAGGTGVDGLIPIYKILDWKRPGRAVLAAFVGLAIGIGLYLLFCFISMVKMAWRNRRRYD